VSRVHRFDGARPASPRLVYQTTELAARFDPSRPVVRIVETEGGCIVERREVDSLGGERWTVENGDKVGHLERAVVDLARRLASAEADAERLRSVKPEPAGGA
jgi:hypothetical protein